MWAVHTIYTGNIKNDSQVYSMYCAYIKSCDLDVVCYVLHVIHVKEGKTCALCGYVMACVRGKISSNNTKKTLVAFCCTIPTFFNNLIFNLCCVLSFQCFCQFYKNVLHHLTYDGISLQNMSLEEPNVFQEILWIPRWFWTEKGWGKRSLNRMCIWLDNILSRWWIERGETVSLST